MLAAFLQECLLFKEHRTQRGISELRSACVQQVLSKFRICSELGTFPAKGLVATQQQGLVRQTWPLPSDSCLRVHAGPVCNVSRCLKEW